MRITGIIYSDLGRASSFMALDWVQFSIRRSVGFSPYPATLNLRPRTDEDATVWQRARQDAPALPLAPVDGGFCSARLYRVEIAGGIGARLQGAVLVPEVRDYPSDKIEIIAPLRLKDHWGLRDGDALTLEFLN